jgi:hypothetical protein
LFPDLPVLVDETLYAVQELRDRTSTLNIN